MTTMARTSTKTVDPASISRTERIRRSARNIGAAIAKWWKGLEPGERVFYRGAITLGAGLALWWPPFLLIIPGLLWMLVFFGFDMRRGG